MGRIPPTVAQTVPGQFITSSLWNAQVVAAGNWLLGSGTDGPPRFKAYASTAQSLTTATSYTALALDTEVIDSDGGHSTVTNTSRYTVQVAGIYLCVGQVAFPGNVAGARSIRIGVNGSQATGAGGVYEGPPSLSASNSWAAQAIYFDSLDVGDYVEVEAWQNSGSTISMGGGGAAASLSCFWMSN